MSEVATTTWAFGGPLAGVAPGIAWTILALAAIAGGILAWLSYRRGVRPLRLGPRLLLIALRTTLIVSLLLCLANPVRVERHTAQPPEPPQPAAGPRVAVLVDRSDSMTLPDNRGRSRLDDALATWRRLEPAARKHFGATQYFSFAESLQPANKLEEAAARSEGTDGTRLYQSAAALLKTSVAERPEAIVILTDGIDTSSDSPALLRDNAVTSGVPVYFVAGTNRSARPEPFLRVREWRVPPTALRSSDFSLEATFEAFSRQDRSVPFSLWQNGRRVAEGELALTMGSNLVSRSLAVSVGEPGTVEFDLRLGPGDGAPVAARGVTQVLSPHAHKIRVLVYQSALDWGLRHFTSALRTDPTFEFSTFVSPEVGLAIAGGSQRSGPVLAQLPSDAGELGRFDCVVLVRIAPKRLTTAQQAALVEFTRAGGCVLFLSLDPEAVPQFGEDPLAALLPVQLEPQPAVPAPPKVEARTPREILLSRTSRFSEPAVPPRPIGRLKAFELTEAGRASPIFARAGSRDGGVVLPRFVEHLRFHQPKTGAAVLAVHPAGLDATAGRQPILLATQPFGAGRSALLTTDTLWRWKLDEPSESRAVETFWQQLLLAIGRQRAADALRFAESPAQVRVGGTTALRLGGVTSEKLPLVTAKAPDGRGISLTVKQTGESETPWSVEWTPDRDGVWEVAAKLDGAHPASVFPIAMSATLGERAPSVPALDAMRALAGETGGALLAQEPPAAWRTTERVDRRPDPIGTERTSPRWNNWAALSFVLGCFALELVLRRSWKLV